MKVGRRPLLPPLLAPEPRPLPPLALVLQTRPVGTQTKSQLEPAISAGVILPESGQFLLLCSLQLWQQLQRCRQTRARVPLFFYTFYFRSAETVRGERHVSQGSEQLQASARVKKLTDDLLVRADKRQ